MMNIKRDTLIIFGEIIYTVFVNISINHVCKFYGKTHLLILETPKKESLNFRDCISILKFNLYFIDSIFYA